MLFAFATEAFAQTGRVTGVVTDAVTNQPLSGVQIAAEGSTIGNLTNQDGRYLLQGLRPGTYTITATLIGHSTGRTQNVRVVANQAATVDFRLSTTVLSLQELVVTGVSDPTAGT